MTATPDTVHTATAHTTGTNGVSVKSSASASNSASVNPVTDTVQNKVGVDLLVTAGSTEGAKELEEAKDEADRDSVDCVSGANGALGLGSASALSVLFLPADIGPTYFKIPPYDPISPMVTHVGMTSIDSNTPC